MFTFENEETTIGAIRSTKKFFYGTKRFNSNEQKNKRGAKENC